MNKPFYVILYSLLITLTSCKSKEDRFAVISGKTTTSESILKLYDRYTMEVIKEIQSSPNGTFSDTIHNISDSNYFLLAQDRKWIPLYLSNGVQLHLDFKDDISQATISGKNINESVYLHQLQQFLTSKVEVSEVFSLPPAEFKAKLSKIEKQLQQNLSNASVHQEFATIQKQNILYTMVRLCNLYPNYHSYYTNKNNVTLPEDFNFYATKISYDKEEDYKQLATYRELVFNHFFGDFNPHKKEETQRLLTELGQLKSENIKSEMAKNLVRYISIKNPNNRLIYDFSVQHITDTVAKKMIAESFQAVENIYAGADAVPFRFENHKGGFTSLEDLKGKVVYIDVWATWCVPCIKEIPHLQQIEKKFHNKNIVFVSISVDKIQDKEKWHNFVTKQQLSGIQLFAEKDFESDFAKKYRITAIPRFIIIDAEGKIVSADAPRPSSGKLPELIEQLLTHQQNK